MKEKKKEEERKGRRRQDQKQGLRISQNEILSSERNVKGKEVNLEVSRVVGQKFRFGVGGRVKGQARLGFRGKQGKIEENEVQVSSFHTKKIPKCPIKA